MDERSLERRLEAAQKTIGALMRRVEAQVASGDSAFAVLEQNIALERIVADKTAELEAQRRELGEALAHLRMTQAELVQAQKLESVGRLASGIAHEINTPIQFVSDNVYFVRESLRDVVELLERHRGLRGQGLSAEAHGEELARLERDEEAADLDYLIENIPRALERCTEGLGRVATIVQAMKEFAHPSQKQKTLVDLNHALASTLIIANNEYKYVADVETDYGEMPLVLCHPGELNQVFLNLIVNAAHAIGSAVHGTDRRGTIGVVTRHEGEVVRLSISDTGTGIPESIRDHVFDPFFTTKEVGKGTGQGLSIARSVVVDKHGGSLTFESAVGVGTTFHVRLPLQS
jgi:two-component system NtrC family sensor kinase